MNSEKRFKCGEATQISIMPLPEILGSNLQGVADLAECVKSQHKGN